MLPTWIIPEQESHEWLDEGSSVFAAQFAPGLTQRQSYGGLRLKLSRRHTVRGDEKAQLLAVLRKTRGRYNVLRTKVHFATRGTGFGSELLTNNTFANGTTGWSINTAGQASLTVADRILRCTRTSYNSSFVVVPSAAATVTQYAPYVIRAMMMQGRGALSHDIRLGSTSGGVDYARSAPNSAASGMITTSGVVSGTSAYFGIADSIIGATKTAGHFWETPYVSAARCALVDNGPNMLLRSEEFGSWTALGASVSANTTTAPDGTLTADSINEDSSASTGHAIHQNVTVDSAAADYCISVALKANTRTWARLLMIVGTSGVAQYVNLSTGALGSQSTGSSWSDPRVFVSDVGNGWYVVSLVARKTSSDTTIISRISLASGNGGDSYSGDGTSGIYAWRATLAQSGVPTRLVSTTTTASTGTSQTGSALHLKGLPASTSGLLLPGDFFEINGELKQATAALNSDDAGLGYLQFEPNLVRSPSNDDPVIVIDPMGKFLVSNIKIDNEFGTQAVVTYDLEHVYE